MIPYFWIYRYWQTMNFRRYIIRNVDIYIEGSMIFFGRTAIFKILHIKYGRLFVV